MNLEEAEQKIEEQEKEILRLKIELRKAKDKLYDKNREVNKMIQQNYDEVRLD